MLPYILLLSRRSARMFITVAKIMIPVMLVVEVAGRWGLIQKLGETIGPAMALLNLPPEAGLVWVSTIFMGIYGGIATLVPMSASIDLNAGQLNALCIMMLMAHSIPVEQAVARAAGAGFAATSGLRLGVALLYGGAIAWAARLGGVMADPVSLTWLQGTALVNATSGGGYWAWVQSTAITMLMLLTIIFVLAFLLDMMERLDLTRRVTALLSPLLRLSGLDSRVAPVTTVGVLLGLTYGGALIVEAAKKHRLNARTRFLALTWLSLSHALIEDTILMAALGANIWFTLVGRLALTLLVVALLAKFIYRDHEPQTGVKPAHTNTRVVCRE